MPRLPQTRVFVVQLSDETDGSARLPVGRIEHVDSGRRGRFSSREEVWRFIERVLSSEDVSGAGAIPARDRGADPMIEPGDSSD